MFHRGARGLRTLTDGYPFSLQQRVLEELKAFATSPITLDEIRAGAALLVSQCYAFAFGYSYNSAEVLRWWKLAADVGQEDASYWYDRIYEAIGPLVEAATQAEYHRGSFIGMTDNESNSHLPNELYLADRIWHTNQKSVCGIREALIREEFQHFLTGKRVLQLQADNWDILFSDEIPYSHFSAFIGHETYLEHGIETLSLNGFNAVHYACMGGHLSILRLVLEKAVDASKSGCFGITPLHLCIFFAPADIPDAVDMLMAYGASMAEWSDIVPYHLLIRLEGRPIDWAIITRNRTLVQAFLKWTSLTARCPDFRAIRLASGLYYPEITCDLLHYYGQNAVRHLDHRKLFLSIRQPFLHWIAHGRDSILGIRQTIELCAQFDQINYEKVLGRILLRTETPLCFTVLEAILDVCPRSAIKRAVADTNSPPILFAITKSRDNHAWIRILERILYHYTVTELDNYYYKDIVNYLHVAVLYGSAHAVRVLLKKGVDVNARPRLPHLVTPIKLCSYVTDSTWSQEIWRHYVNLVLKLMISQPTPAFLFWTQNFSN